MASSPLLDESVWTRTYPAVSVAVVRDGRLILSEAMGESDLENRTPATTQTRYRIASLSKPITATAVLQLAEAGRLSLHDSVRAHLPELPAAYEAVSLRDLLRHTGGVRHYRAQSEFVTTQRCERLSDALSIFASDPLDHAPGERITYSTWGFTLLGLIIERVSGQSYADYVRTRILEPARMRSTEIDSLDLIPFRAEGYTEVDGRFRNADLLDSSCRLPAGGFVSTAEDMARFATALMDGTLLSPASVAEMTRSQLTPEIVDRTLAGHELPPGFEPPGMGYGWAIERLEGRPWAYHGGNQPGATAVLYLNASERTALAILTNLDGQGEALTETAHRILARLFAAEAPP